MSGLIRVGRKVVASKTSKGKHCFAVYATLDGVRQRHSHYLTKESAKSFAKLFKSDFAKKLGVWSNIKIVNACKRK